MKPASRMSPALNGRTALQLFKCGNTVEIRHGIMFDFYPGLPHIIYYRMYLSMYRPMAQSNSMSSLEALIQAAQYLEENGRKYLVSEACVVDPPPPCHSWYKG